MKKDENGRSMVEMLGVLAIIGVLSVAGIYGYTIAMRRFRANEIVQTASVLTVMAHAADGGAGDCMDLATSKLSPNPGGVRVDMVVNASINPPAVEISLLDGDPDDVLCDTIRNIAPSYECGEAPVSCSD